MSVQIKPNGCYNVSGETIFIFISNCYFGHYDKPDHTLVFDSY